MKRDPFALAEQARAELEAIHAEQDHEAIEQSPKAERGPSIATQLVKLAHERFNFYVDTSKAVYAQSTSVRQLLAVESQAFRDALSSAFYKASKKAAGTSQIREAVATIAGIARDQCLPRPVYVRCAFHNSEYWLDLGQSGNSKAVCIGPGRWCIVAEPDVLFYRPASVQALPDPISGGSLDGLWSIANIPPESRLLVTAFLAECLRENLPKPLLEVLGGQGSGKSVATELVRSVIDPNEANLRAPARDEKDLFIAARSGYIVTYENASYLDPTQQDGLCRLATGGAIASRKLYTNDEESILKAMRPVILNGIVPLVTRPDLLDRTITINLPKIEERIESDELRREFHANAGLWLGALLDMLAQALALLPSIVIPAEDRPRLVEFAKLGCAIAKAQKLPESAFLEAFNRGQSDGHQRLLETNPIAAAVMQWVDSSGGLYREQPVRDWITTLFPSGQEGKPSSPKGLTDALRRAAPLLEQMGISVQPGERRGGLYRWGIGKRGSHNRGASPASPAPPDSANPVAGRSGHAGHEPHLYEALL